jgi:hypothetical protein
MMDRRIIMMAPRLSVFGKATFCLPLEKLALLIMRVEAEDLHTLFEVPELLGSSILDLKLRCSSLWGNRKERVQGWVMSVE